MDAATAPPPANAGTSTEAIQTAGAYVLLLVGLLLEFFLVYRESDSA